ncbi:MAG: LysR family transcriptional regulator [Oscillospiraceae bacterium]
MEVRVLKYFLAVAREQNISAAAESLFLSQPTLSRQLKELEDELGKQLFIRGNRKITLTEDGIFLRKRAEEIIELIDKTEKEITLSNDNVSGEIYIGAGETDGLRLIAKAAKELQEEYPQINYHITSGDAVDILERLDKGLIDFALLLDPVDIAKYSYLRFPVKDVWGVLMRRDCPLAEKDSITPADLHDMPLIVSRQALDGSELTIWLKKDKEQLNITAIYNLVYNASLMVDEGLGVALCLDKIINVGGDSSLCFRPLAPKMEIGMSLVWKKYQVFSKAAEKFISKMQKMINAF